MRTKRVLSIVTLAAFAALAFITGTPAAQAATSTEQQFISAHNRIRAEQGRPALSVQSDLSSVARAWSQRMASDVGLAHNPNLGSQVKNWDVVGENVGYGGSVDDLMNAFMNSPDHRSNILDTDYNQFGAGAVIADDGTIWVTIVFAHRATSTVRNGSTSVRRTTTTTTPTRRVTSGTTRRSTTRASAPAPAPAAPAAPAPVAPPVRTVNMLLQMIDLH